jgi:hypothetical protein
MFYGHKRKKGIVSLAKNAIRKSQNFEKSVLDTRKILFSA